MTAKTLNTSGWDTDKTNARSSAGSLVNGRLVKLIALPIVVGAGLVAVAKVFTKRRFQRDGYRVFTTEDNGPTNWMSELSHHYERTREQYPQDRLMIIFDIDGTIIDMRYVIRYVLLQYDEINGTSYFENLDLADVNVHENHVDTLLKQMGIPTSEQKRILKFWAERRWETSTLMESHRPFMGVMEIIRWLQMQHNVVVSLNTGRPERMREDTLRSLNALGSDYNVRFASEYLHMNSRGWEQGVANSKAEGVRKFQKGGYRVFAMVDNEPANLMAVCQLEECRELLPLHANTIFESDCRNSPCCETSGSEYVLTDLASEETLPPEVALVWHGVNDKANLRQFLGSDVTWGEIDVRTDPKTGALVLHHDRLYTHPEIEHTLELEFTIRAFNRLNKSINLDFKEGHATIDRVLDILAAEGIDGSRLWFNGDLEILEEEGYRKLHQAYPSAIVQCPIDSIAGLVLENPLEARDLLGQWQNWGINRFSIKWDAPQIKAILDRISEWGFEVNIYDIPDLDSFLKMVLLAPKSITADFNFPQWNYFGRGAGKSGEYFDYSVHPKHSAA